MQYRAVRVAIHALPLSYDPGAPKAIIYSTNYKDTSFNVGLCRVEGQLWKAVCGFWPLTPLKVLVSLAGHRKL